MSFSASKSLGSRVRGNDGDLVSDVFGTTGGMRGGADESTDFTAKKLLFTVGAHEGLKSGSETGRNGVG